ncbi:MAG: TonB-dependent receptor [Acidobacteriota bacterium]
MLKKFKALPPILTVLALLANLALPVFAQNPTGSIRGAVKDQQGAVITNAKITAKNKATGDKREGNTGDDGLYTIPALQPGEYEVTIEAQGFSRTSFNAVVEVGSSFAGDVTLTAGGGTEVVDIAAGQASVEKENHQIAGVINQKKIDALPLNGRNFLQLALLEPGVSVSANNPGAQNNLFNVSIGGGPASATRLTVDGGSIVDPVCGGAAQNFSTETVQEFQISTYNFDLSTGVTSVGAINIVSRQGGNDMHGSAFLYFRDHNLSAIPTLKKPSKEFDPFFRRYQYGGSLGGPIKKDKAFYFGNVEWLNQDTVFSSNITGNPIFQQFNTSFPSAYDGILLNIRGDYKWGEKHNIFTRYSFDDNSTVAPDGNNVLPSRWRDNKSRDHNAQAGITSLISRNLVNDFRFNFQRITNDELIPSADQCPSSEVGCIGLGGVHINFVSSNLAFGNTTNAPQNRRLNRYQYVDNVSWEKGSHRLKFGAEWEHNYGFGKWEFLEPGLLVLYDPEFVGIANAAFANAINGIPGLPQAVKNIVIGTAQLSLPAAFTTPGAKLTVNDILGLPLAAGAVGIGDPSQPPPFNGDIARQGNRYRFYVQDAWRIRPNFTFLYGGSYQYETNLGNHDLAKPRLLASLLSSTDKAKKDKNNFAPSIGFTWDVGSKGDTVIRGGAGLYYDTILFVTRLQERATNGPAGNGRSVVPTAYFQNNIAFPQLPTIPGLPAAVQAQLAAAVASFSPPAGTSINFVTNPTKFTGANFMSLLAGQKAAILSGLQAAGAAGFSGLDFFKTGSGILDSDLETPYSEQFSIGVQRKLTKDMLLNVDFVLRKRVHSLLASDYNRTDRVAAQGGRALPACVGAQIINPTAICSNGAISVTNSNGRNDYRAMLVKLDKRFSNRYQLTASYALQKRTEFPLLDLNNWFGNPIDAGSRHSLTVSGLLELPWGLQGSLIAIYQSTPSNNGTIPGSIDVNGDGTRGDTLPGLKPFSLGRGTDADELRRLVAEYNSSLAGKPAANGATFPTITLPAQFQFGDDFWSHDVRLSKNFKFAERYNATIFIEAFNLFNISNLTGFSGTLNNSFGQATGRVGQNFGTGGPRALQIGGRFSF